MIFDRRATTAVATTLFLWASAFVAIRIALTGFGAPGLSLGRLLVASAALAAVAPLFKVRMPARSDFLRIAACGLSGMTAYQLLLNAGERTVPAGTASMLVNTGPIFAALLAFLLLREKLGPRGVLGIVLGFVGALIITFTQGGGFQPSVDALLVLGAAVSQALFFVLQKPLLARYQGIEVTCYATWTGTLFSLPMLPWLISDLPAADGSTIAALVFLGVGPSAIGFATWAYAQSRAPVATVANTLFLVPFLAIGIGWVALQETIHPLAVLGGLIAIGGVAVSRSTGKSKKPAQASEPSTSR